MGTVESDNMEGNLTLQWLKDMTHDALKTMMKQY
jgi:hypothetical protein